MSKAKYEGKNHKTRKNICIQRFLNKFLPKQSAKKIEILGDNKTSLILIKNLENQNCTKYIDIIYYHIQRLVKN